MILVIVLVHSVAANEEEVCEAVGKVANDIELRVGTGVCGVRLRHSFDMHVFDITGANDPDASRLIMEFLWSFRLPAGLSGGVAAAESSSLDQAGAALVGDT